MTEVEGKECDWCEINFVSNNDTVSEVDNSPGLVHWICDQCLSRTDRKFERNRLKPQPSVGPEIYTQTRKLADMPPSPDLIKSLQDRLAAVAADALHVARVHKFPLPPEFGDNVARANTELTLWIDRARRERLNNTSAVLNREVERDENGRPKGRV